MQELLVDDPDDLDRFDDLDELLLDIVPLMCPDELRDDVISPLFELVPPVVVLDCQVLLQLQFVSHKLLSI